MLRAKFSKQWRLYQDRYLGNRATKRKNGTTRMTGLMDVIFKEWWKLWELRNGISAWSWSRYTDTGKWVANLAWIGTVVQWPQRQGMSYIPVAICDSHNNTTKMKMWALRQWINTWKPVIEESYKTALETGWCYDGTFLLFSFLPPSQSPCSSPQVVVV